MAATNLAAAPLRAHSEPRPSDLVSVGKAANLLGVSTQTIRMMMARGELDGFTLTSGHRRLSRRAVLVAAGESVEEFTEVEKVIVYCRVSGYGQATTKKTGESDLTRQIERMRKVAQEKYPNRELVVIKDIGSGMNFEKPGLDRLISGMLSSEFKGAMLLVEHKDRLARWAVPIIEKIAAHANVKIEYVEQTACDDEAMLVADLLAITHLFSIKVYSKRSAERRRKKLSPEFVDRATTLINEGMALRGVTEQLAKEGFTDESGKPVTYSVVRSQIAKPLMKLQKVLPSSETPAQRYLRQNTEQMPKNYRVERNALYTDYCEWAVRHHVAPVSAKRLFANVTNARQHSYFKGLRIKGKRLHSTVRLCKENKRTTNMREKLAQFCEQNGLSEKVAKKQLATV